MRVRPKQTSFWPWLIFAALAVAGLGAGVTLTPAWGMVVVMAGVLWWVFFLYPEIALAVLLSGFQLYPLVFAALGLEISSLTSGIFFVILFSSSILGSFVRDTRRAITRLKQPASIVFIGFVLYIVLSWLLWSEKSSYAIIKLQYTIVIMVPSFFAALWLPHDRVTRLAWWAVLFGVVGIIIAVSERFLGILPSDTRLSLPPSNPIQFANSIGVGALFLLTFALSYKSRRVLLIFFLLFITFVMVIASGSRGSFIALMGSLFVFFLATKRWRRSFWFFVPFLLVLAIWLTPYITLGDRAHSTNRIFGRFTRTVNVLIDAYLPHSLIKFIDVRTDITGTAVDVEVTDNEFGQDADGAVTQINSMSSGRVEIWEAAWKSWQEKPWLGIGYGNFDILLKHNGKRAYYAHNLALEVMSELGIVGTLLFVSLWGMGIWRAISLLRHGVDVQVWIALSILIYASLAGLVSYSFSYFSMYWMGLGLIFSFRPQEG